MFNRTTKTFIPAASYRKAKDVVFLELRNTVFCTECELICYNNSSRCLACGSAAVLSLARVLGGSLRGQERARMTESAPAAEILAKTMEMPPASAWMPQAEPAYAMAMAEGSSLVPAQSGISMLAFGVERARVLTDASGAAVAMQEGGRMVCRGRAGVTAPEVGAEVPRTGLTALCARTGRPWNCQDTEREPWANRDACRRLGIRSVVVAPVLVMRRVLGILEVFSPSPAAFDDEKAATVQLMASAIAVATLRNSLRLDRPQAGVMPEN